MALRRREWIATFADPAVVSDLRAAARDLMRQGCDDHEPDDCGCELNRFTPEEFVQWVELEVQREGGKPMHLHPAGAPGRRREGALRDLRVNLSSVG